MLEFYLGYSMGQSSATRAASLARSAAVADGTHHTNRIEDLNERIDRLVMILRATLALLEEQGITPEKLMAKIEELDLQDGVDDERVREPDRRVSLLPVQGGAGSAQLPVVRDRGQGRYRPPTRSRLT